MAASGQRRENPTYQAQDLQDGEVIKEHEASGEKGPLETAEGLWGVSTWRKRGDSETVPHIGDPHLCLGPRWVEVLRTPPFIQQ